ncbi:MAG: gamma-glutamyltransferase family protein [Proteobacteria bacterium]|nr:gamma-glutamyltransferase family protein [Pseudomonadota bacterium]
MFTTRPEILGTYGVVASTHWLASAAGMAVLERGGNAFDAAAAAGFTLQVVEPHLNGPGGDAPILIHEAASGHNRAICGQGVAPRAATIERFRGLGLDLIPGTGMLAAVVPGAFDAWMLMLRDYGTLRLRDVLAHAIGYAEHGYPLVPKISQTIEAVRDLFAGEWTTSAAVYLRDGEVPEPGSLFANRALSATYRRLLDEAEAAGPDRVAEIEAARRCWHQGFIATAIDRFCRDAEVLDLTGRRHKALLTGDDLASWRAAEEKPLAYDYGCHTVLKCGPWSQGPVLLQQLALLEGFGVAAMDPLGPDFVHTVVECAKLAFADREAYYGDPAFVDVPIETLLSKPYNAERRKLVARTASMALRPGRIEGREAWVDEVAAGRSLEGSPLAPASGAGEPTTVRLDLSRERAARGPGDTCHLDVIDRHGNMVSATPSGGWLQSSPVIPGLGFCLGTRAQMFWLKEGVASSLAPGKRPRTTLTPSLALRDGDAYMAFGTPGGDQQDQWQAIFFLRHVDHGMNLQEAIDAPSFHSEHWPSSFWPRSARPGRLVVEGRFPPETVKELVRRGHDLEVGGEWSEGRLSAAARDGRILKAAANPRGMQGYAVGR